VGATPGENTLARLGEAGIVGLLAAVVGGGAGLAIGYSLVSQALRIDWAPGLVAYLLPVALGLAAAIAAGAVGGAGAAPRVRGQMVRLLSQ